MRAVVFDHHGPIENLVMRDLPIPEIGPDQCLIKVRAVSLNGFDPMVLRGIPGLKTPLPMIPGADIMGVIEKIGADVPEERFSIGQRVGIDPSTETGMMGETRRGGMCEYLAVEERFLVPIPDGVTDHQAACLPTAYATAHRMLFTRGQLQAGEKVLILGASGGVGTSCIQLAVSAGAEVVAVSSSAAKLAALKDLGAQHVIDGSQEDFVDAVWRIYGKPRTRGGEGGVDVCVNYSGGDSWAKSFRTVCKGGRILTCGATGGYDPKTDIRYIWSFEHKILGCNGWERVDHLQILQMIADGRFSPVIDRVVDMGDIQEAMRDLAERRVTGKVVLEVGP
ncbi:zinc-binding dehydrogenase [Rhodobacteraceae bacterium 2CG4]|uniref:Zinc-binding dehydrogenase n=2 Tax=Halovulum marinum TaxID=2662447 RepID=A0A6L5Z4I8_9RHOB|nr:zinc-binding dehydrogenase [Halovulum marinum]